MATDMFLTLDDIKGESQDARHKDAIEVLSWTWGLWQPGNSHSGTGSGSGKLDVRDLTLIKYIDRSTPNLIKLCCSGKHFAKAKLLVRKAGGSSPVEYLKIEMSDGIVTAVKPSAGAADTRLTETIQLNFASFKYEYTPQSNDGRPSATIPAQWNIAKNSES